MTLSTLPARRSAFRVGMPVQWHPETNPGMDAYRANDRGVVLAIEPYSDAKHIDMVIVLWDSLVREADPDQPISNYGRPTSSRRIRRVFVGGEPQ